MSTDDIAKGRSWSEELTKSLKMHRAGIICVTPENHTSAWLNFEAGALSRSLSASKVIPFLLGLSHRELDGPLAQFQSATLEIDDFFSVLCSLNEKSDDHIAENVLRDRLEKCWPEFRTKISAAAGELLPGDSATVNSVVRILANHGIDRSASDYQIFFKNGFETHAVYSTVTEIAASRLLIFGRKNRKLFDKEHGGSFKKLKQRVAQGLDFRVMFLDAEAPAEVLFRAHRDNDLADQLRECARRASTTLGNLELDPKNHVRTYRIPRTISFVVVDGAVLYSSIALDEEGRAKPLTDAPFTLVNAAVPLGKDMIDNFEILWKLGSRVPQS
jgi:hypothetical protein